MPDNRDASPTTSLRNVLLTFVIGLAVAMLLGAEGIVHAGEGMDDGPMRSATLTAGRHLLSVAQAAHLTWPWDEAEMALGRQTQPAVPPILSSSTFSGGTEQPGFNASLAFQVARWAFRRAAPRSLSRHGSPHLRVPTSRSPLRLLVTGDSLSGYLGPELVDEAYHAGPTVGFTDTHNGTGLVSPNFVDWSVVAQQQVAADNPDAVVVLLGGNDFQNMTLSNGRVLTAGTAAWTREYQRRAAVCMRIWTQGSRAHRVYWLSVPPARDTAQAAIDRQINIALPRAAKQVPGTEYLNILGSVTNHGRYADFVQVSGQPTLVRQQDGVHLTYTGSTIVAHEVLAVIKREWRLGTKR